MAKLLDILRTDQSAICEGLAEKLTQSGLAALVQSEAGSPARLLAALENWCEQANPAALRSWAEELRQEFAGQGLGALELLSTLRWLERVVLLHVVRNIDQRKALLAALAQLGDGIEVFRRLGLDGSAGAAPRGPAAAFSAIVDQSPDFICLTTPQGKPFYLNPAGRQMVGLTDGEEIEAGSLHPFHPEDSWAALRDEAVPAVNRCGRWEGQCRIRNLQTDETQEVLTTMLVIREPGGERPECLALIHRPAGERARLEAALAEAEARKAAILETSLDPIITINHAGVITEFNRAAEQTFGHPRQKVLGTKPSDVLFPTTMPGGQQNRIDRYLAAGEGSLLGRRVEVMAIRANGEVFPAELTMTISMNQGEPLLTFFVRDISERKAAEEEQERHQAELERSNEELQQFAYVASHDLQEPLRKILTFGDRLQSRCGDSLDEMGQECVERMQNAARRMQTLIDGLLTLSRVTTKGREFVSVDLAKVAREVVTDLEVRVEKSGALVEVGHLPTIQADPLQMRQLLQNLIGNALKFRCDDVPLVVKVNGSFLHDRESRRGVSPADERCRLVVEDNGIGFEQRYADRIFGVFQRLHSRESYEGTGIGLAICKKIAERHGGTITARGEPGQGACFEVILPVIHPRERD